MMWFTKKQTWFGGQIDFPLFHCYDGEKYSERGPKGAVFFWARRRGCLFGNGEAGILKGGVAVRTCTDRICAWVFQRILPVARRETAGNQLSLDSGEHNGPGVGFWR